MPTAAEPELLSRREGRALASPLRLTVAPGADPITVDRAWAAVRTEFDAVDLAMSRYREDSEITALHRGGSLPSPSRRLAMALAAADRAARMTAGRFDARVIVDLERLGSVGVPQSWDPAMDIGPAPGPVPATRAAGGRFLRRQERRGPITLLAPIDLGGIGKGLALRWAARRAAAILDATGFLLEAGGDIASRGLFGEARWSIGIEDPAGGAEPVAVCVLEPGQSVATSSVLVGRWMDAAGRPVHHLIDPSTGEPGGAGLQAVTVASSDPAWAEVWSKALFLEGAGSVAGVARRRGLAAWWVDDAGQLSMTPAARQQTSWVRAEAVAGR